MSTDDLVLVVVFFFLPLLLLHARASLPIQSDRMGTGHSSRPWTLTGRGWSSTEVSPHACCLGGVRFHARVAATWTPVNDPGSAWRVAGK